MYNPLHPAFCFFSLQFHLSNISSFYKNDSKILLPSQTVYMCICMYTRIKMKNVIPHYICIMFFVSLFILNFEFWIFSFVEFLVWWHILYNIVKHVQTIFNGFVYVWIIREKFMSFKVTKLYIYMAYYNIKLQHMS